MPIALRTLLLDALRDVTSLRAIGLSDWDRLIRVAGETATLSHLALAIEAAGLDPDVPRPVRPHLESARALAARHRVALDWELSQIECALSPLEVDVVLLKGAAYHALGLPTSAGRLTSDVDILVSRDRLAEVEQALKAAGWEPGSLAPRDQAYFRQWMHELPPLVHRQRRSVLDVHHTIVPPTDRLQVDAARLLAASVPITGRRARVLAPADLFLHSAVHLFRNGRWAQAVRDLLDMDGMLRRVGPDDPFWNLLPRRALELGLRLPCAAALRALQRHVGTPIPAALDTRAAAWGGTRAISAALDGLADRAFLPRSVDEPDRRCLRARAVLEYWPLPRLQAMLTPLFWTKRLPTPRGEREPEMNRADRAGWPHAPDDV